MRRKEGKEGGSQHDKDKAKTGHRLTVFFMLGGWGWQKLCCTVTAAFHISTLLLQPAAISSDQ